MTVFKAPPGPQSYSLCRDQLGEPAIIERYTRSPEAAITATERARLLSISTEIPHEVRLPDGRLLARYVNGKRADLAKLRRP